MAKAPAWVLTMRAAVIDAGFADGWSLIQRNGKVQVQHSWIAPGGERQKATAMLPIEWKRGCTSEVINALQFVRRAMDQGKNLKDAVANLEAHNPDTADAVSVNWDVAFANWRRWKVEVTKRCSSYRSFDVMDGARWKHTFAAVNGHPQSACDLFEAALWSASVDEEGNRLMLEPGSVQRRKKLQTVNQFLNYCVSYEGFDERWKPPVNYAERYLGRREEKINRYGIPEEAIPTLMGSFRDTAIGRRWRLAIGLMICFGLRPWELRHLRVEGDYLRVLEGKRNSRKTTDPRICVGLDPEGMPGLSKQLLVQLLSGEPGLPPLGNIQANTAGRVRDYLKGIPFWMQLKADCAARGEELVAYSFRHRYAFQLDARGFNDRLASSFMGNTHETFARHYGDKAREDELKAAAEALLGGPGVELAAPSISWADNQPLTKTRTRGHGTARRTLSSPSDAVSV